MELKKRLPKKNSWVQTPRGEGKVIDGQILTQLVVVEYEGGEREAVSLEEVTVLPSAPVRQEKPQDSSSSGNNGGNRNKSNNNAPSRRPPRRSGGNRKPRR
jgi:hypothetical protein